MVSGSPGQVTRVRDPSGVCHPSRQLMGERWARSDAQVMGSLPVGHPGARRHSCRAVRMLTHPGQDAGPGGLQETSSHLKTLLVFCTCLSSAS